MNGDGEGDVGEDTPRPELNNVPVAEPETTKRELIARVAPASSLNVSRSAQRSASLNIPNSGSRQNISNVFPQRLSQASTGAARPQLMNYRLPVSQQQRAPAIRYDTSPASQLLRQRQGDVVRVSRSPYPLNANGQFHLPSRVTTTRRTVVASSSQAQGQQNQQLPSTISPEQPATRQSAPEQMASAMALQQVATEQAAARAMYVMEGGVNNINPVTGRPIVAPAGRAAAAPPWMSPAALKRPRGRPPLRRTMEESQSSRTLSYSGPSFLSSQATSSSVASSSSTSACLSSIEQAIPSTTGISTVSSSRASSGKNRGFYTEPQFIEDDRDEHFERERQARNRRHDFSDLMQPFHEQVLNEEFQKEQADAALQRLVKQQFSGTSNEIKVDRSNKEIEDKELEWAAKLCVEENLRVQAATNERVRQETLDRMRTIDRVARKKKSNDGSGSDPDKLEDEDTTRRRRPSKKQEGEFGQIVDILIKEDHDLLTNEGQQRVIEAMDKQREEERKWMLEAEARRKACELEIEQSKLDGKFRSAQEKQEVDTAVLEIQRKIKEDMDRKMALRSNTDTDPPRRRRRTKLEMEEERMAFTGLKKSSKENSKTNIQRLCMLSMAPIESQPQSSQQNPSVEDVRTQDPAHTNIEHPLDMSVVKEEDDATFADFQLAQQLSGQSDNQESTPVKIENDAIGIANLNELNGLLNQSDSSSDEPDKIHGSRRRKGTKPVKVEADEEHVGEKVYPEVVREEIVQAVLIEEPEEPAPAVPRQEIYEDVAREEIVSSDPGSSDAKTDELEESSAEKMSPNSSSDVEVKEETSNLVGLTSEPVDTQKNLDRGAEKEKMKKQKLISRSEMLQKLKEANLPPNPRNSYKYQEKLGEIYENAREDHPPLTTKAIDGNMIFRLGRHFQKEYESIIITFYPKQIFYGEFELEITHKCHVTFVMDKNWPRIEFSLAADHFKIFPIKHIDTVAMVPPLHGGFPPMLSLSTNGLDEMMKSLSMRYKLYRPPDTVEGRPIYRCHPDGLFMLLDVCTDKSKAECKIDVFKESDESFKHKVSIDTAFDVLDSFYQLALALHPMIDNHRVSFVMLDESDVWDYCNHLRLIWVHIIHETRHPRWIAKCREDLTLACDSNFVEFDADTQLAYSLYPPTHKYRALQRESNTWFDKNYSCRDPFPISFKEYRLCLFENDPFPCTYEEDQENEGRLDFIDGEKPSRHSTTSEPQGNSKQHGVKRKQAESTTGTFSVPHPPNKLPRGTKAKIRSDLFDEDYADSRFCEKTARQDRNQPSTSSSHRHNYNGPSTSGGPSTSTSKSDSFSQARKTVSIDMFRRGIHPTELTPENGDSPAVTAAKAQEKLRQNIINQHKLSMALMPKREPEPGKVHSEPSESELVKKPTLSLGNCQSERFLEQGPGDSADSIDAETKPKNPEL